MVRVQVDVEWDGIHAESFYDHFRLSEEEIMEYGAIETPYTSKAEIEAIENSDDYIAVVLMPVSDIISIADFLISIGAPVPPHIYHHIDFADLKEMHNEYVTYLKWCGDGKEDE